MNKRPDCEVCKKPESAMVIFAGRMVCGECAVKKDEEIKRMIWGSQ